MMSARRYIEDWRTFLPDAALGYRNDGMRGVWLAFAERSIYRLARHGHLFVFAQPVETTAQPPVPSGVTIAPLKDGDWSALTTLVGQRELKRFRALIASGRHCIVAWRGRKPVGYTWVAGRIGPDVVVWPLPLQFPEHAAYLYNLYVLPSERCNGIGSALASARLHTARQLGFREGWRMVAPSNGASLRTIRKTGTNTRVIGEIRYIKLLRWTYSRFTQHDAGQAEIH